MLNLNAACHHVENFSNSFAYDGPRPLADRVPLTDFLRIAGLDRIAADMRVHTGPYWPIEIVDSLGKWIIITYPADAAAVAGSFGTAVKTSDALRWRAEECQNRPGLSDYLLRLAEALDAETVARPEVADPAPHCAKLLEDYLNVISLMNAELPNWSGQTLSLVEYHARQALQGVAWGKVLMPLLIPYPADCLPPGGKITKDGYGGEFLSSGWLLRKAIDRATYVSASERRQMTLASRFYPHRDLCFEVRLDGADPQELFVESVSREHTDDDLDTVMGSVHLDFEGLASKFSSDPSEYDFRLYRPTTKLPEDDDFYFLVSELVTYLVFVFE